MFSKGDWKVDPWKSDFEEERYSLRLPRRSQRCCTSGKPDRAFENAAPKSKKKLSEETVQRCGPSQRGTQRCNGNEERLREEAGV